MLRDFLRGSILLTLACFIGCGVGIPIDPTTAASSSGSGGEGGGDEGPCGIDCSKIQTPECTVAVCNTGQLVGPVNTCVVVEAPDDTPCDDGKFCTVKDHCQAGACTGDKNTCGNKLESCMSVLCYEDTQSCDVLPSNDGDGCTPENLCQVNGVCHLGECLGEPKDCTFSPLSECNTVACDQSTGKCVGSPDPNKNDKPCLLTGDLCTINRTCLAGQCQGGVPKDCSAFDSGCKVGTCEPGSGFCGPANAPVGTPCNEGIPECAVGACDVKGDCQPSVAPNGTACNDHNSCTKQDSCTAGACMGSPVAGCSLYLTQGFESCPGGFTLSGDWQCGTPASVGPPTAHTGDNCIATQIAGLYHVNQSFSTAVADSPPINLAGATNPKVSFWAYDHTEGGTFDGWDLRVSTNGGQSFTVVTGVTPPYNLTLLGDPAWGGNNSQKGWQNYSADLTPYVGQSVILRFAFRSDGATVFPGVYIDDVVVAEPLQLPLHIVTPSLLDVYAGQAYSVPILKVGGTGAPAWSIKPGGVNANWLTINPTTGVLSGTPSAAEVGPVTVTIHVEEPGLPSNFDEKTYTFKVIYDSYYTSFEGACPAGWTLTGDWQCGTPINVGPGGAYVGTQCLATQIAGLYNNFQTYAGTTATSPDIDLSAAQMPTLSFRMWVDTEGSTYDGVNLQISNDGGMNYSVLNTVSPGYTLTIQGQPAWGGHQSALGWQLVTADLSAYAGQTIRLRFAFQTDSSGIFPGVYIDDFFID